MNIATKILNISGNPNQTTPNQHAVHFGRHGGVFWLLETRLTSALKRYESASRSSVTGHSTSGWTSQNIHGKTIGNYGNVIIPMEKQKKLGLSPWRVGKAATEASISISAMRTSFFSDLPWGASSTNPYSQSNNTLSHYSLDQNFFKAKDGATWPFLNNGCFEKRPTSGVAAKILKTRTSVARLSHTIYAL